MVVDAKGLNGEGRDFGMNKPGIYDDLCTHVRKETESEMAIVIIVKGNKGSGFSVQTENPDLLKVLPDTLEFMAQQIRQGG